MHQGLGRGVCVPEPRVRVCGSIDTNGCGAANGGFVVSGSGTSGANLGVGGGGVEPAGIRTLSEDVAKSAALLELWCLFRSYLELRIEDP